MSTIVKQQTRTGKKPSWQSVRKFWLESYVLPVNASINFECCHKVTLMSTSLYMIPAAPNICTYATFITSGLLFMLKKIAKQIVDPTSYMYTSPTR